MTAREHSPRPGVTWQQQPASGEQLVPDDWQPAPPASRAQRRAAKRAHRQKGRRR
jgi:hypothetical protein